MTFEEFIMQAREMNASDIHLTVGAPTVVRVNGELRKYTELSDQVVNRTILSILSAEQEKMLTEGKDIDFSFELKNGARQRVNVFRQSGKLEEDTAKKLSAALEELLKEFAINP